MYYNKYYGDYNMVNEMNLYDSFFPYTQEDIEKFIDNDLVDILYIKIEKESFHKITKFKKIIIHLYVQNTRTKQKMMWMGIRGNFNEIKGVIFTWPEYLTNIKQELKDEIKKMIDDYLYKMYKSPNFKNAMEYNLRLAPDLIEKNLEFTLERESPGFSHHLLYLAHIKRYLLASEYCKDKIVLDAGCGMGYGAKFLSRFASRVYAIDIAPKAISIAKNLYNSGNIKWKVADACSLPIKDQQFDVIVSLEMIEHLKKEKIPVYIKEMARVLKKDGVYLISTPNKNFAQSKELTSFHLHEMSVDEFEKSLKASFKNVKLLWQRGYTGKLPLEEEFNIGTNPQAIILAVCTSPVELNKR